MSWTLKSLKVKIASIEAILLKFQPCWAGHISKMRNHIVQRTFRWPSQQRDTKEAIQVLFEKITWCLSQWPLQIVHPSREPWSSSIPPSTILFPPLKPPPAGLYSRTKGGEGRTATLYHQTLKRHSATAAVIVPIWDIY